MRIKTSELVGAALDWAVHVALHGACEGYSEHEYSTDWAQGGPIIERKGLCVTPGNGYWGSVVHDRLFEDDGSDHHALGPTPLIAAMRCYVASELGDTVDIPEELTK
jgi:hypothetical protein